MKQQVENKRSTNKQQDNKWDITADVWRANKTKTSTTLLNHHNDKHTVYTQNLLNNHIFTTLLPPAAQ